MIRINKYLSICGVTSRRGAEQLIKQRKVTINDLTVEVLGTMVNESEDIVKVNGTEVNPVHKQIYLLLNKPKNVLTTLFDPFGRKTILYYLKGLKSRIYPVGRLDFDTDGVLLMTNDGELAYRLAHPKYEVEKVYRAVVNGTFTPDKGKLIANGIKLEDGHIGRAKVKLLSEGIKSSKVVLVLTEGHKREVKQLLKAVGTPVRDLCRIEFAGLRN
ncbi:MAG: rRNA pseudouridine synthase, partial [candidate division Zixibacteria bacterium]|nr:rRNA pseudouridine synthase [candidate division Zixibacteria bacterium]